MENKENSVQTQNDKALNNGRSIEKQIGVVFLKTLGVLIALIIVVVLFISLCFPRTMSNFTSWLGMEKTSLYFAKVQYERDDDINSLYTVINKAIALNAYDDLEKYSAELFEKPNYYDFIAFIEAENMNAIAQSGNTDNAITLMISLANEDMYLKNRYVLSLIENGKVQEAIAFAQQDFALNDSDLTLNSRLHWAYTYLIAPSNDLSFLDASTCQDIVEFTNLAYELYIECDANYQNLQTAEQFNFFVLQNTLKRIYNELISLKNTTIAFDGLSYDEIEARIKVLNGEAKL